MLETQAVLELQKVKETLAEHALLDFTKKRILDLTYSHDYYQIEEELAKTNEALTLCNAYGRCPISYIHDLRLIVARASKASLLSCEDLYRVASQATGIEQLKAFAHNFTGQAFPHCLYYFDSLLALKALQKKIEKCISPNFDLYDKASAKLAKIRQELRDKDQEIHKILDRIVRQKSSYLSDTIVTLRNDRLVVPVKANYKYSFGGIIHDESASQQTVYIEPEATILLNAQMASLRLQEVQEIERILRELSKAVALEGETLLNNQILIEEIDFLFAKGSYGRALDASVAKLSKEQVILLKGARHPLLDQTKAIGNNFALGGKEHKICLITGPNTGGKTVALKTVGLLALMNQCGLAIPCDFGAELGVFEAFFADIGDGQSLSQSLSTFSAHLLKLKAVLNEANAKSLVLIDELGSGTDPSEGEALAMAILEELKEREALVLATTHYPKLKSFAFEGDYISNASMLFDEEELKPTYKLVAGLSGRSYALEIAKNLGFSDKLIKKAKDYKRANLSKSDLLVEKLENSIKEEQVKLEKLGQLEEELRKEQEELALTNKQIKLLEEKIKERADEEIALLVDEAMESINETLEKLKKENLKPHEVIAAKAELEGIQEKSEELEEDLGDYTFKVGDYVTVLSTNKVGRISEIRGKDYLVDLAGLSLRVKASNLRPSKKKQEEKPKSTYKVESIQAPVELNLIGKRVDEALSMLDKYLDDVLRAHLKSVRIIHGYGTGALKKAVYAYLKDCKYVKDYHHAGAYDGGMGATIVVLKD